jgi:hypothetical protein
MKVSTLPGVPGEAMGRLEPVLTYDGDDHHHTVRPRRSQLIAIGKCQQTQPSHDRDGPSNSGIRCVFGLGVQVRPTLADMPRRSRPRRASRRRPKVAGARARRPQRTPRVSENQELTDVEFVQVVRAFQRRSLLSQVAAHGARFNDRQAWFEAPQFAPWILAEIARTSLTFEQSPSAAVASEEGLLSCCAAYQSLSDPQLARQEPGAVGNFMLRMAAEQLVFQQSVFQDFARTAALFDQPQPDSQPRLRPPDGRSDYLDAR